MVTIRQIAKECGYSKASVWLALNKSPRLPEATREKILKVANDLGYKPNPALRTMLRQVRAGKPIEYRSTLALFHGLDFPDPEAHVEYHRELVKGITERVNEFGYEIEQYWLNDPELSRKRIVSIMKARGIKGIICTPFDKHQMLGMEYDDFALVAIGFTLLDQSINRVEVNHVDATALCIRKLYEFGYQRIGFVQRTEYEVWREFSGSAPYLWMQSKMPKKERSEIISVDETSKKAFLKWFEKGNFDSLIVNHEIVVEWLKEKGVGIPEDVGIVFPTPTAHFLNYAHVHMHPRRVGNAAADVLMAQLQRGEFGRPKNPKNLTTDVSWSDGVSLKQVGPAREWVNLNL